MTVPMATVATATFSILGAQVIVDRERAYTVAGGRFRPTTSVNFEDTDVTLSATSDEQGRFGFQLLAPGNYGLQAVKPSFDPLRLDDINISVTETLRIELRLHLATVAEHVEVRSELSMAPENPIRAPGRIR